jgi:methylmalonyl-CoA mutase C-terminal domain/subunit
VPQIQAALVERQMSDVLIVVGGIIPDADAAGLTDSGVGCVFGPGSKIADIVTFIQDNAPSRDAI